jgi:hypothetical protein
MSVRCNPTPPCAGAGAAAPCDSIVESRPVQQPTSGSVQGAMVKPEEAVPAVSGSVRMAEGAKRMTAP